MSADLPGVPDDLRIVFKLIKIGKLDKAWSKSILWNKNQRNLRLNIEPVPTRHIVACKRRYKNLENKFEELESLKFKITSQVKSILESTSWQITRPLRSLSLILTNPR